MFVSSARWPHGTGQWSRTQIVVVSADPDHRARLARLWSEQHQVLTAQTPLELIAILEVGGLDVSTAVIADVVGSTSARELTDFLDACYPWLRVVTAYEST